MTCSKLQVPKIWLIFVLKGIPNQKKSILKINIACSILDVWQVSRYPYVSVSATWLEQLFQIMFQA